MAAYSSSERIVQHQLREELRLDERHRADYTSMTDYVKDGYLIDLFTG